MWQLLGVLISGITMGALAFGLRKATRDRIGPWLVPTCAAIGIFGFLIVYDYTWYDNKISLLPEKIVLVEEKRDTSFFRMWSYVHAPVSSFKFYDGTAIEDPSFDSEKVMLFMLYEYVKNPIEKYNVYAAVMACDSRSLGVTRLKNSTIEVFKDGQSSPAQRLELMRKTGEWKRMESFEEVLGSNPVYQQVCKYD